VNVWLWASVAILAVLALCGLVAVRGSAMERLLGLQLGGAVTGVLFLVLGEGFGRSIYFDLALVFTVLSFASTLVVVRFLERWM